MSFPLKERKIGGYKFGVKTWYNNFHLGTDYYAVFVNLYAPFNGTITKATGSVGGRMIYFKPDNQDVVIRFLHLREIVRTGRVQEGEFIAVTGDTGNAKGMPHLHVDISKHDINLNKTSNFIDPEKFNWGDEDNMKLVNDKGTVYIITGNKDKRKIGIADLESLGIFGDEEQIPMDTTGIPEYQTIVKKQIVNK
ncbi:MAG: M23 family metallopeptidase [Acidobacteriota bacterium]|nr:M23 family metallopeptidase [Acidobacteriota bacterium]